jgi:hypothetical protein
MTKKKPNKKVKKKAAKPRPEGLAWQRRQDRMIVFHIRVPVNVVERVAALARTLGFGSNIRGVIARRGLVYGLGAIERNPQILKRLSDGDPERRKR